MSEKIPHDGDGGQSVSTPKTTSKLTAQEVIEAFASSERYGPILSLELAAELAHRKPSTLKRLVSEGKFKGSVFRGKPLLFWRNKFVPQLQSMK